VLLVFFASFLYFQHNNEIVFSLLTNIVMGSLPQPPLLRDTDVAMAGRIIRLDARTLTCDHSLKQEPQQKRIPDQIT